MKRIIALLIALSCIFVLAGCSAGSQDNADDATQNTTDNGDNAEETQGEPEAEPYAIAVGEHELSSAILDYYFRDAIDANYSTLYSYYGSYAAYFMGFDVSQALNEQVYNTESGQTWADYYLEIAIENATAIYALYDKALADGFQLPEEMQTTISSTIQTLKLSASLSGTDLDSLLRQAYGENATEQSYLEHLTVQATASAYYNAYQESLQYDDAAIRAYEAEHYYEYSTYSFNVYQLNSSSFPTAEDALSAVNDLAKATTVEELDAAIAALEINADAEEVPTSTQNTDVAHTSLQTVYSQWLSSDERKAGDTKVFPITAASTDEEGNEVETVSGYYVMMFQQRNDNLDMLSNVRHILIGHEGGTTDEIGNTVYSDEDKADTLTKAEALLQQWKDGDATEESFIALVADNTADTGSAETGGLYENIHKDSNYVENFLNWAIDNSRQAGDTGIVESPHGYHIMYYVGDGELSYRDYLITQDLILRDMTAWQESIISAATMTKGDLSSVNIGLIYMPASA